MIKQIGNVLIGSTVYPLYEVGSQIGEGEVDLLVSRNLYVRKYVRTAVSVESRYHTHVLVVDGVKSPVNLSEWTLTVRKGELL